MNQAATSDKRVFEDAEALSRYGAEWLCALAVEDDRRFAICCSGGTTPKRLYEMLAEPPLASRFPWQRVHWFWADERFVPHDSRDSNYRMVFEALFSRVEVPKANIHAIATEGLSPDQAATAYAATLKEFYGTAALAATRPLFDVTLLGIGEDGHTASLFPNHPALEERERWALPVTGARPEARITLTYPVLDSSRDVCFLATGAGKRAVVARVQSDDRTLPASRLRPAGRLHWFTDRAAAPEQ